MCCVLQASSTASYLIKRNLFTFCVFSCTGQFGADDDLSDAVCSRCRQRLFQGFDILLYELSSQSLFRELLRCEVEQSELDLVE